MYIIQNLWLPCNQCLQCFNNVYCTCCIATHSIKDSCWLSCSAVDLNHWTFKPAYRKHARIMCPYFRCGVRRMRFQENSREPCAWSGGKISFAFSTIFGVQYMIEIQRGRSLTLQTRPINMCTVSEMVCAWSWNRGFKFATFLLSVFKDRLNSEPQKSILQHSYGRQSLSILWDRPNATASSNSGILTQLAKNVHVQNFCVLHRKLFLFLFFLCVKLCGWHFCACFRL